MTEFRTTSNGIPDCVESCTACAMLCIEAVAHGQKAGGPHFPAELLSLLTVCADICGTAARAMLSGSGAHILTCAACALVCRRCADSCGRHADEPKLRACASACANAARCCTEISQLPRNGSGYHPGT